MHHVSQEEKASFNKSKQKQLIMYLYALLYFYFLFCNLGSARSRLQEATHAEEQPHDKKTVDRDNRRNCQQVYTSSPIKSTEKLQDAAAGESRMYTGRLVCYL